MLWAVLPATADLSRSRSPRLTRRRAAGRGTYDALGNLRSVALPSKTITYKVDGRGRRVSRSDGTTTQHFLYRSKLQLVAELDASDNLVARYVYVTGRNVPDYMMRNDGHAYRIITDHLGSVRLVVDVTTSDANQRIAQRIDYDPWGNLTRDDAPRGWRIPFGFAGGLQDRDTGLVRFGARDYDPEVGRWTAKDPLRFGGRDWNLYGYVVGDPVNGVDVSGLWLNTSAQQAAAYDWLASFLGFAVGVTGNLAAGAPFGGTGEVGRGFYAEGGRLNGYTSYAVGPGFMPLFPAEPGSAGFGVQVCVTWIPGMFWGDGRGAGANAPLCGADLLLTPTGEAYGACISSGPSVGADAHFLFSETW